MTLEQLRDSAAFRGRVPERADEHRVANRKAKLDPVLSDSWKAWQLARQLRDEWRRERYARLRDE